MLLQTVRLYFLPPKTPILMALFQKRSYLINPGQAGSGYNSSDAWDYFHINSVDKEFGKATTSFLEARRFCSAQINGTNW